MKTYAEREAIRKKLGAPEDDEQARSETNDRRRKINPIAKRKKTGKVTSRKRIKNRSSRLMRGCESLDKI